MSWRWLNDSPSTVAVLPIVRVAGDEPLIDLRVLQEDEGIELLGKIVDDEASSTACRRWTCPCGLVRPRPGST